MITVKTIKVEGDASMVEYVLDGRLQRATIPTSKIKGGEASVSTLSAGIPFGTDWENLITIKATPVSIANALRNRGVWTPEDALANPRQVVLALQTACAIDISKIFGGV
jgi:hypothetical protein